MFITVRYESTRRGSAAHTFITLKYESTRRGSAGNTFVTVSYVYMYMEDLNTYRAWLAQREIHIYTTKGGKPIT